MCLFINEKLNEKGLKGRKVHPNGMVKVWKILRLKHDNALVSPWKEFVVWKPGWNKSNRHGSVVTSDEKVTNKVENGIHVFLSRAEARRYSKIIDSGYITDNKIIPVYVNKKDLVDVGRCKLSNFLEEWVFVSAVFTKVFFKKEDYNKALKIK